MRGDGAARGLPDGRGRELLAEGEGSDLLDADSLDDGSGDGVAILQRSDADQVRERGFAAEDGLGLLVAEQLSQLGAQPSSPSSTWRARCRATRTTRASILSAKARS